MPSARLQQLLQFYKEDPNDPFNIYALAMEYWSSDPVKAIGFFKDLLENHKDYLPTYYQATKMYEQLGEIDNAISVVTDGIALARKVGDVKTQRELQSAYDELMY